jgi:ribosomal protein S18 acetylase RimI-like enzyme
MIGVRGASVKDLVAINGLTFEMHNYLVALVGIKFAIDDLKHEMYQTKEAPRNVYVAELDGKVVGYMSFSHKPEKNEFFGKHYHLYHIAVKQEHRGKGIATKLFKRLQRKAKQENVNIVVGTLTPNKQAIKFYQKMGFKPISISLILDNTKNLKIPTKWRRYLYRF